MAASCLDQFDGPGQRGGLAPARDELRLVIPVDYPVLDDVVDDQGQLVGDDNQGLVVGHALAQGLEFLPKPTALGSRRGMGTLHQKASEITSTLAGFCWLRNATRLVVARGGSRPNGKMVSGREFAQIGADFSQDCGALRTA